ncbi:hypothetical protein A33Q_4383 [Indibacter alkaliphilus LW1]|jgi:hypothetical protein|uniref:Uncharacterized protein n=1 Tax=Indibacter alkaliphilus (strain CCUG 57479 / KCTC 22604 / LW1) TaxID=1189612 RepID=S2D5E2_INDAL|nr:hypothetical protein [Indibacter alkaliphilus]EOZ92290.1 hypothetical protein A33Q_4383 [Indibacter alkaliphilus LW1]
MKFPSIFRTAKPMRFDIKPRYYDPVKEEINHRTEKIKRELQADGVLPMGDEDAESIHRDYGSSLRGAFTSGSPIKGRQSSPLNSAGLLRLIIFVILIGALIAYVYLGPDAIYAMLYIVGGIALVVLFFRLRSNTKRR